MPTAEKQPDGTYIATIDEFEYRFTLWGAKKGLEIGVLLGALLSKPAEVLGEQLSTAQLDDDAFTVLTSPIAAAFEGMGKNRRDAVEVIETLATHQVQRRLENAEEALRNVGNFDNAYRGRLGHLRKVVMAAAEVQYSDFFAEIAGALASARLKAKKKTTSASPVPEAA